jgi:hypothetical protein
MPVVASRVDSRLGARAAGAAIEASALFSWPSHSFLTVPEILRIGPHFCSHSSSPAPSFLLLRTARVLAVSAGSAYSFSATPTPPRSRLPTWSTRVLSTTAATRNAPAPESNSSAAPAPTPAAAPKPKPELKHPSPAELQTRYEHSSDALHALLAHPALFAPLRRPRFPIILCHGTPGRAVPTGQRPSSSARRSSTAHSPRACTAAA